MEELGVQPLQDTVEEDMAWSPGKTESTKKVGLQSDPCHRVTIVKTGIELESKQDEENRKAKLY